MNCKIYLAMKMGGITPRQIEEKSNNAITLCEAFGLIPVSPWTKERIHYQLQDWDEPITASPELLVTLTKLDKDEIRNCHVVIDIDGDQWSKGTALETGFNRYYLMRPTVYVSSDAYQSLRGREGDYVAKDLKQAIRLVKWRWGTRFKRILWRLVVVYKLSCIKQRLKDFWGGWG